MHDYPAVMLRVPVLEVAGPNCVTADQGERVYERVVAKLRADEPVELNFDGVLVFASPFFNALLGRLITELPPGVVETNLKTAGLSKRGMSLARRVIENAREYIAKDESQRRRVDDLVLAHADRS